MQLDFVQYLFRLTKLLCYKLMENNNEKMTITFGIKYQIF